MLQAVLLNDRLMKVGGYTASDIGHCTQLLTLTTISSTQLLKS